jgi:hypothetical protein
MLGATLAAWAANTIYFSPSAAGITKSVPSWGVDTAWPNFDNVRQSIEHIGPENVDVVRLTFHPAHPLTPNGDGTYELSATAKGFIDNQLALAAMAGPKPTALLPGEFSGPYDPVHWLRTIKATQEYINSRPGFTTTEIASIEAFNEPDFWFGQGSPAELNSMITQLKALRQFRNTEFPAGSTLNSDNAWAWYDPVPASTEGSSHLLGGSLTSWVNFMEHVTNTGKPFVNPELHSLGEAIVGAEHGMSSGIFWADVLRARSLFVQASDGNRLGYFEDLGRQSAAAVYRAPDGNLYAFAGGLERFGQPTAYRFVSTDQDVYFNGIPVREYMLHTKFDEFTDTDSDFSNYGSWSSQGAYADIDLDGNGVPALDGHRWRIVNAGTDQVMEVVRGGTGDGALIRSATDIGALHQLWNIVRTRNGYYHLFNANSGRTAEVAFSSLDNGASVRQWGTADNQTQQWFIEEVGDGTFYIRNGHSNKYLTSHATNSTQGDLTGSTLQQWRFVLANPTDGPTAHYELQGDVNDSAGSSHATALGSPGYSTGPSGAPGSAIDLDGVNDYVQLPSGLVSSSDITVSAWVKWDGGGNWQRVFDFGNNTTSYMFLTPRSADNTMRFAITTGSNGSEQMLETSALPVGEWVHLTMTLGGNTGVLYVNGAPRVAGQIPLDPADLNSVNNYIGKSQWPDPLFNGAISDFQIYDYALTAMQVDHLIFRGDLNGDGVDNAADYPVWRNHLGATGLAPYTAGDADGDGAVTQADYAVWRRQFGQTFGAPPAAQGLTVPEPAAEGLFMFGVASLWPVVSRRAARLGCAARSPVGQQPQ